MDFDFFTEARGPLAFSIRHLYEMDNIKRAAFLRKYSENKHTEAEHLEFIAWLNSQPLKGVEGAMDEFAELSTDDTGAKAYPNPDLVGKIELSLDAQEKPVRKLWPRFRILAGAALVLLALSVAFYFYGDRKDIPIKKTLIANDIAPGGNRAILTLANGKQVVLDSANIGLLANEGNAQIKKTADGQLVYTGENTGAQVPVMNTISVPRGGEYRLMLPDGTKIRLNSGSTLTYPTVFAAHDRTVNLVGEAYFEVAQNKASPFRVITGIQTVEVLGTHFNICGYPDEGSIKTTLLEGSVKVIHSKDAVSTILKPAQQAVMNTSNGAIAVGPADTEEATAWKDGYFILDNEDIKSMMRKLSRWYDVEVVYEGTTPRVDMSGLVSRSKNISEVLKVIELTGSVHFKIEGRRIIVMH